MVEFAVHFPEKENQNRVSLKMNTTIINHRNPPTSGIFEMVFFDLYSTIKEEEKNGQNI